MPWVTVFQIALSVMTPIILAYVRSNDSVLKSIHASIKDIEKLQSHLLEALAEARAESNAQEKRITRIEERLDRRVS